MTGPRAVAYIGALAVVALAAGLALRRVRRRTDEVLTSEPLA